jgi:hypothetical protein
MSGWIYKRKKARECGRLQQNESFQGLLNLWHPYSEKDAKNSSIFYAGAIQKIGSSVPNLNFQLTKANFENDW